MIQVSLICGDAIHCLRSALDHLAFSMWEAAGRNGREKEVGFPVARDQKSFKTELARKIKGISNAARDALAAIEPYQGGQGESLWILHELNNTDKHRLLITAAVRYKPNLIPIVEGIAPKLFGPDGFQWADDAFATVDPAVGPDRWIETGHELFTDTVDAEFNNDIKYPFDVAFKESGIIEGELVLPTLSHFVDAINDALSRLTGFV